MRSACVLEWLRRHGPVHTLVLEQHLPVHSSGVAARLTRNVRRALRGIPPMVDRFFDPAVAAPLEELLRHGPFDLAVFEQLWTAPWIQRVRPHCARAILDLHNCEAEFCLAMGGPLAGWFARCADRWERRLMPQFDQVWDPVSVPSGLPLRDVPTAARSIDLAFSGTMAYPPNRDALDWLATEIWPAIRAARPNTSLAIIGKNPEFVPTRLDEDPNVTVTGPVEDALEWLGKSRIAVVPLRRGSGVSIKLTEGWQAGCAVVATPVGARGYAAPEAMIQAASTEAISQAILDLLADDGQRERLAHAGRQHFEEHYSWPVVFALLDQRLTETVPV